MRSALDQALIPQIWAGYFRQLNLLSLTTNTFANRQDAKTYPNGAMFYASDYNAFYVVVGDSWMLIKAFMSGIAVNRPKTLGVNDSGFEYFATDTSVLSLWTGTQWIMELMATS